VLVTDGQGDLRKKTAELDGNHTTEQLVAAADLAELAATKGDVAAFKLRGKHSVNFAFGDAMVPAGRLGGFDFAPVDPLLERGVTNAKDIGGFTRSEESLQDAPPKNSQNGALRIALSIRFYTVLTQS